MENAMTPNIHPDTPVETVPLGMLPDGSYAYICRWCGEYVVMSPDEVHWYIDRNFAMPTRCLRCRRKRRGAMKRHEGAQEIRTA